MNSTIISIEASAGGEKHCRHCHFHAMQSELDVQFSYLWREIIRVHSYEVKAK